MIQEHILSFVLTVASQIAAILGIFFVFGALLSVINRATNDVYRRSIGWKGILWTAWIGTPVHELGHIVFAKLFLHRITHVSFFAPNPQTGGLGHVEHSYRRLSIIQRLGNFFIGIAPLLFGALVLFLLLSFLHPGGHAVFSPLRSASLTLTSLSQAIFQSLTALWNTSDLHSWKFWLFLYLSFCVSAHMSPSREDRSNMWDGFWVIIFLLALFNLIAVVIDKNISPIVFFFAHGSSIFLSLFLYATVLSTIHYLVASIVLFPLRHRLG